LEFFTFQNNQLSSALTAAQTAVTSKQSVWSAAVATRDDLVSQLAAKTADSADVRKKLAAATTPEDVESLRVQLENDIIDSRTLTGELVEAKRLVAVAKSELDVATSEVQRLTTALAASSTALDNAKDQDKRRTALKATFASAPLATVGADAAAVEASVLFGSAQTRLQGDAAANPPVVGDIPKQLVTEAEKRLATERKRLGLSFMELDQAQGLVGDKQNSDNGVAGAVSEMWTKFQQADDAFTIFVTTAVDRLKQAKTILAKVADPTVSPLTPAQSAQIQDATLVGKAGTAATQEALVNVDSQDLAQKQAALDQGNRQAISANIDLPTFPPTTAVDNARATLNTDRQGYTAGMEHDARVWEAAVPDSTWRLLADFETAKDILDYLQHPAAPDNPDDPGQLLKDLNKAESDLVTALLASDKSDRTVAWLQTQVAKWAAITKWELSAIEDRRFSAVRGDF
jgi:hypothetical protein